MNALSNTINDAITVSSLPSKAMIVALSSCVVRRGALGIKPFMMSMSRFTVSARRVSDGADVVGKGIPDAGGSMMGRVVPAARTVGCAVITVGVLSLPYPRLCLRLSSS